MKWLTVVFAVYMLGLSLWPCADDALPLTGRAQATVITTSAPATDTSSSDEHEHQHDRCSPFCTCACCAVVAAVAPLFAYSAASVPGLGWLSATRFHHAPANWAEPLSAIWQPPKHTV